MGDTHVHTALSGDAFNGGVRLKPEDGYRFARGEAVVATSGQTAKLERPLDFIVLADHANNIGAAFYRQEYLSNPEFRNSKLGREWLNAREKLAKGHIDEASLNEGALLRAPLVAGLVQRQKFPYERLEPSHPASRQL